MTTATYDPAAAICPKRLADELKRLWDEPTAAACRRVSRETESGQQAAQLDAWEDDGGTTVPRRSLPAR